MKPKRCFPVLALVLALLIAAPALPAQESPDAEGLEGSWILTEYREKDGEPIPPERMGGLTTILTLTGRRFTLRSAHPATGEVIEETTGTFKAAGGKLLFVSGGGEEPEDIAYTLEDDALSLFFRADGRIFMTMIFRRE